MFVSIIRGAITENNSDNKIKRSKESMYNNSQLFMHSVWFLNPG